MFYEWIIIFFNSSSNDCFRDYRCWINWDLWSIWWKNITWCRSLSCCCRNYWSDGNHWGNRNNWSSLNCSYCGSSLNCRTLYTLTVNLFLNLRRRNWFTLVSFVRAWANWSTCFLDLSSSGYSSLSIRSNLTILSCIRIYRVFIFLSKNGIEPVG